MSFATITPPSILLLGAMKKRVPHGSTLPTPPRPQAQPSKPVTCTDPRSPAAKWFYLVSIMVILAGLAVHLNDMRRIGFVVADDMEADLKACQARTGGLHQYITAATVYARFQGRVGMPVAWGLFLAPYFVDQPLRADLITLVHFLSFVALAAFAGFYFGLPAATLILVALTCLVPNPGGHYPIAAYPMEFQAAILLFFLAACMHELTRNSSWHRTLRWSVRLLIALTVLVALCVYEALDLVFAIISGAVFALLVYRNMRNKARYPVWNAIRSEAPMIVPFPIFALAYILFRIVYPTTYNGTMLSDISGNWWAALKAAIIYSVGGLPGANWVVGQTLVLNLDAVAPGQTLGAFLMEHIGWPECVLAAGVALVVGTYALNAGAIHEAPLRLARDRSPLVNWRAPGAMRKGLLGTVILMVVAVVGQLPVSIVDKYQRASVSWSPYVTSYIGFLCFCAALGLLLPGFAVRLRRGRAVIAGILALLTALCVALTREASSAVLRSYRAQYATWRLVDGFLKTERFGSLPAGAVILAPNLWDRIAPAWELYRDYWQQYMMAHGRRPIRVVRTYEELAAANARPGLMYYMEVQQTGDFGEPVLLLTDLVPVADGGFASQSLFILSTRRLQNAALAFLQPLRRDSAGPDESGIGSLEVSPVPPFRYSAGYFVSVLNIPDTFTTGTAFVQSGLALSRNKMEAFQTVVYNSFGATGSPAVAIDFGPGFSGLESSPGHHWHWSDGASGEAAIRLWNRARHPVSVVFNACIITGYAQPSKLLLRFRDTAEALKANAQCGNVRRELALQPGSNDLYIKSYAPRLNAPGDPRYMVFGVFDWTVSVQSR
jgi:hypothetical protein